MNRREALKALGAAACPSALYSLSAGQAAELKATAKPRWKTAIGLNGFQSAAAKYGKSFPINEVLAFAARTGFDGVELVPNWPAPMTDYPAPDDADAIWSIRRMYESVGLQVFAIQTWAAGAFDPNPAVRKAWLERWRGQARFAKAVGAECIGIWPGGPLGQQTVEQALDRLSETFREVWKIAGDLGLTASFEVEPPFVFNCERHIRQILERVPAARTHLDPSHYDLMSGGKGQICDMLKRIGVKRIGYVHLTDCDGTLRDGGTSKHLPCGEGHVDIAGALAVLREGAFEGWLMVDAWETPDPYLASLKGKQAIDRARA